MLDVPCCRTCLAPLQLAHGQWDLPRGQAHVVSQPRQSTNPPTLLRAGGLGNDVSELVAGHFTPGHLSCWTALVSDPWVVSTLTQGYNSHATVLPPSSCSWSSQDDGDSQPDLLERTTKLEQQITDTNQRVSNAEDQLLRHDCMLPYMLQREANLSAKCEDLKSRARHNNLRTYGVPEGEEKNNMISFITDLIVETAHWSLNTKPKNSAPPRSIIMRFSNYRVKEKVIQMAWSRRDVTHHDINMRAVSPFPVQLKIYLDSSVKTFATLARAASTLEKMGILVKIDECERFREKLLGESWTTVASVTPPSFPWRPVLRSYWCLVYCLEACLLLSSSTF
uniref:L1 transposable element RRM domain-containing protein n=1 Tax=Xiphophorus couchianus TaxID=32473 RepID=A0A3B5M1A6_9TELE